MSEFRMALTAFLIPCGLLLAGCTQQPTEDKDASVVVQQPTLGINLGTGVVYPIGFPLPQYPGSKITTSSAAGNDQSVGSTKAIVLTSSDDIYKIGFFYQNELVKSGWQLGQMSTSAKILNLNAVKGKNKAVVTVSQLGDRSAIAGQDLGKCSIQLVVTSRY